MENTKAFKESENVYLFFAHTLVVSIWGHELFCNYYMKVTIFVNMEQFKMFTNPYLDSVRK